MPVIIDHPLREDIEEALVRWAVAQTTPAGAFNPLKGAEPPVAGEFYWTIREDRRPRRPVLDADELWFEAVAMQLG